MGWRGGGVGWQRATGHAPGPHVRPPVMWQAAAQGQAYGVPEGYEQQYAEGYEQQYAEGYEGQQYAEGYEGQEGCASSAPAHHRTADAEPYSYDARGRYEGQEQYAEGYEGQEGQEGDQQGEQ